MSSFVLFFAIISFSVPKTDAKSFRRNFKKEHERDLAMDNKLIPLYSTAIQSR